MAVAASWNDGFYSNRYTWLSGSATYALDPASQASLSLLAATARRRQKCVTTTTPFFQTTAVPLFQNNERVFNSIYTYNSAPWTIYPYLPACIPTSLPSPRSAQQHSPPLRLLAGRSASKPQLWRGYTAVGRETCPFAFRIHRHDRQGSQWRGPICCTAPTAMRESITLTPDSISSAGDLLRSCGDFPCRNETARPPASCSRPQTAPTRTQTRGMLEVGVLF